LASDFAQTLQQNKFGHLDPDVLPSGVGPKLVADEKRKAAVKEAFVWSWNAYEKYAWGSDEVRPCPLFPLLLDQSS
jgi:mannosyl-oligosaccharide alpha-1,2-mannosidase